MLMPYDCSAPVIWLDIDLNQIFLLMEIDAEIFNPSNAEATFLKSTRTQNSLKTI